MNNESRPRCFVTGATGHLGSALVRLLLEQDYAVAILMRPASNPWRLDGVLSRVEQISGALDDCPAFLPALRAFQPRIVFHLAWEGILRDARNSTAQLTGNVTHTLALLEVARDAGARAFVGIGSQAEYSPHPGPLREDSPTAPQSPYGVAKLALSLLTDSFCRQSSIRSLWLRVFSVYGPKDDPRHLLPALIDSLLQRRQFPLTAGEQLWDYLYIDDAVEAILSAAAHPGAHGIFNIASGRALPLRSILATVRDLIDPTLPLALGEIPYGPGQLMHLEGDITRLTAATGWAPRVPLAEGLARTVAYHRHSLAETVPVLAPAPPQPPGDLP